ncbi:MAG: hypothetical protein J5379_08040 [Clostridiales bacterium]|nr:hypothetical protein [Clostridiales bacterium]
MKTVKKLVAVVLVSAMALSLAACGGSKKKIDSAKFKEVMEKEGFTVMETDADEGAKESCLAYNEDMSVMLTYSLFEKKDDAKEWFDGMYDSAKEAKDAGEVDKLSKSGNKITASGDGEYIVIVMAEEMIILGTGDEKSVDSAIKALGY